MALVGHISGSSQSNSVIGISGSVIVADRPGSLFPAMPGTDIKFFVSGSATERAVFGGDLVGSGSLTLVGNIVAHANTARTIFSDVVDITLGGAASTINVAGDLKVSGNDIKASDGNTNITLTSNTLTAFAGDVKIGGNDIQASDGNTNITLNSNTSTTFAGNVLISGNQISGSAGGNITLAASGDVVVAGDLTVTGNDIKSTGGTAITLSNTDVTIAGDLQVTGNDIKASDGNTNITLASNTLTTFAGDIRVNGNDIQASDGNANITMTSNTLTTFSGDIKVGGNDIQASNGTVALTLDTSGNVTVAGDLQVTGNDIKSSTGGTAITLSGANVTMPGSVTVSGDLTVNGTTITADVATFTVEDPLVGFGFTSGSVAVTAGDRGWIGGISGGDNVAMYWRNNASEFRVARTNSTPDATSISETSLANLSAAVVRANSGLSGSLTKLTDGTSYLIAGSGITVSSASNGAVTIAASGGGGDVFGPGSSTQYAVALFNDTTGKVLRNSQLTTNGSDSLWIASNLNISGSTTLGDTPSSDTVVYNARVASDIEPSVDRFYNLGSPSRRWNNIFTGDLHLKNERGNWTIVEEADYLSIRNNNTGKMYKFVLQEIAPEESK